jgi:hypothetical protein
MNTIIAAALLASTILINIPMSASATTSLLEHNGSVVYLVANGNRRELRYLEPRQGMLQAGARAGSVLFSGRSVQGRYLGTAFIFNRQCGPTPYEVSGPILNDDRTVILTGLAPRLGADCRVYGYLEDTLKFTYLRSDTFDPEPAPPQTVFVPAPVATPAPMQRTVIKNFNLPHNRAATCSKSSTTATAAARRS